MNSKLSLVSLVALVLSFAALPLAQGQEAIFKPTSASAMTPGSFAKIGAGGVPDNATTGTATSTAAAATINADSGKITTESLTTAGLATYTLVLTNSKITAATNKVFVSFETTSAGSPVVGGVAVDGTAHTATIKIYNAHATVAFNSTFKISFFTVQ